MSVNRDIGRIETRWVHPESVKADEVRLFAAHRAIALKGHASEFPLAIKTLLSAPMIPADGGPAKVATLEIDVTRKLLVHNRAELSFALSVTTFDEEGDATNHVFCRYSDPARFGDPGLVVGGSEYHSHFVHHPDYIRNLIIDDAQRAFSEGVAALAQSNSYEQGIDALRKRIRGDVDAAFDNIFYAADNGTGMVFSRSTSPRLVMDDRYGEIVLDLGGRRFDPVSSWTQGLISFPANLAKSATEIRDAVISSEAGSDVMIDGNGGCDARINGGYKFMDTAKLDAVRDAEFAIYANAVCDMARAVMDYPGATEFSTDTRIACSWFASIEPLDSDYPMDMIAKAWDDHLVDLRATLRDDDDAFSEFLKASEWPLKASPITVMAAKLNKLLDRDMLYGLDANKAKPASPAPRV
ncbi:hypothetical protein [Rhizobium sp. BK176]|uniref:hypothetical protein n=1 Tax=Rhizobium sp. BK176 TaxID=2587071 RepID=UPI00216A516D|nr:hypothetical protein [Rhizobium sp. BK176]MCS4089730.1 hypothetical protein [Rhizobium sp. BK176]